jgi:chemotaxis protein MotB
MKNRKNSSTNIFWAIVAAIVLTGCVSNTRYNHTLSEIARMRMDCTLLENRLATIEREKNNELMLMQDELHDKTLKLDSLTHYAKKQRKELNLLSSQLSEVLPDYSESKFDTYLENGYLHITLPGRVLFNRGEDRLTGDGQKIIREVAGKLQHLQSDIMILGHTDNVPFHSDIMDNWKLSIDRAHSVMQALVKNGLSPDNLILAGKGKHDAAMENDTQIGQLLNRRIELVLMPDLEKLDEIIQAYAD